ncbi:MAG: sigma factor, partial [Planococcus donghaensis]
MAKNLRDKKLKDEHIEQVMSAYGEYLMRLIYLYVKDWSIAEDILQEVFFTYYQKANQFEHRSSLKTYLSKMAINRCHDYLRSWKNKRIIFTETVGNLLSNSKSIEESYE